MTCSVLVVLLLKMYGRRRVFCFRCDRVVLPMYKGDRFEEDAGDTEDDEQEVQKNYPC